MIGCQFHSWCDSISVCTQSSLEQRLHRAGAGSAAPGAAVGALSSVWLLSGAALHRLSRALSLNAALEATNAKLSSLVDSKDSTELVMLLLLFAGLYAVLRRRRALRNLYGPPPGPLTRQVIPPPSHQPAGVSPTSAAQPAIGTQQPAAPPPGAADGPAESSSGDAAAARRAAAERAAAMAAAGMRLRPTAAAPAAAPAQPADVQVTFGCMRCQPAARATCLITGPVSQSRRLYARTHRASN